MVDQTSPDYRHITRPASHVAIVVGRDVVKQIGSGDLARTVIDRATFEVASADRISLAGASGSGKSTLLHMIAGLVTPSCGSLEWPVFGSRDALRPSFVSFAFQGPSLLSPLSVRENVELPLLLLGTSEGDAREQATAMLARFGLEQLGEKFPEELSGGQAQRAGVARALVGTPQLIVADEPTGQCDRATAHHVLDVIDTIVCELGCALIVASHDPEIVGRMDRHWSIANAHLELETP